MYILNNFLYIEILFSTLEVVTSYIVFHNLGVMYGRFRKTVSQSRYLKFLEKRSLAILKCEMRGTEASTLGTLHGCISD